MSYYYDDSIIYYDDDVYDPLDNRTDTSAAPLVRNYAIENKTDSVIVPPVINQEKKTVHMTCGTCKYFLEHIKLCNNVWNEQYRFKPTNKNSTGCESWKPIKMITPTCRTRMLMII